MKLMVIANCHCLPLSDAFNLSCRGVEIADFIDVNFITEPRMVEKIDLIHRDEDWRVMSFNLSANFGRIETNTLKQLLGPRLKTFTNIHFDGLHPDITYDGGMGQRVASALGDYHSKIVLGSYVSGRSWEDCLRLFNGSIYENLGYYQEFDNSAMTLSERDTWCDLKFSPTFIAMAKECPVLYTINHPTGAVFIKLAELLALSQGLGWVPFPPEFFLNHLSTSNIWPVYDEIAEFHGLKYRTPQYYIGAQGGGSRLLSRAEFVQKSYESYKIIDDQGKFLEVIAGLPFFETFKEIL